MSMNCVRFLLPLSKISKHCVTYAHFAKISHEKIHFRCYSSETNFDLYSSITTDDFEKFDDPLNYNDADFESLSNGDPDLLKTLKVCQLEMDILAQEGSHVPSEMTAAQWLELASTETRSQRLKFIRYLWLKEMRKSSSKRSSDIDESKLKRNREKRIMTTDSPVVYGLLNTTLFHRFYEPDMKKLYNFRLLQAMMYGPHILVDCGFVEYMKSLEITATVKEILNLWSLNREYFYPYDITFCNFDPKSSLYSRLCGVLPPLIEDPAFPFNHTTEHYLDLYPKDKLIYLTPDCNEVLESYDHDSIYILGGIMERGDVVPLTLAKAKRDGIRMAKFPLNKYLKLNYGIKTLSLVECIKILHDLKDGHDWNFALRYLHKRGVPKNALLDDCVVNKTSTKTSQRITEDYRNKQIYNLLLDPSSYKRPKN